MDTPMIKRRYSHFKAFNSSFRVSLLTAFFKTKSKIIQRIFLLIEFLPETKKVRENPNLIIKKLN